jgi:hypothetical protein
MSSLHDNPFLLASGNPTDPTFPVQRSVRFRSSASAYFVRTPASTSSRTTWTWSGWVKLGSLSIDRFLFNNSNDGLRLLIGNNLWVQLSSGTPYVLQTNQVFRDPSAWHHIVWQVDTTQATASNRMRLYVNGVEITSFSTATYPPQNYNTVINTNTGHYIGSLQTIAGYFFDGYLTEVNFIDGQALTPSSFGGYNSGTGVWEPRKYSGTYGTNGFYLNFQDNSGATATTIGKDSSGNSNNWTPNNISVTAGVTYDSMLDVPTNTSATNANFATMSPITGTTNLSNGNLYLTGAGAYRGGYGTIALPATGKWYWEGLFIQANNNLGFGLAVINPQLPITPLVGTGAIGFNNAGQWWVESSTATTGNPSWTATTVVGMRYDASTGEFSYSSNGSTWTTIVTGTARFTDGRTWVPACWAFATNDQITLNFGQRPFTYTPPTGFVALNTFNLPDPIIANGANQFAATTYTGTGANLSIVNTVNNTSMQPDFVWIKGRNAAWNNVLRDSVRGSTQFLYSNTTGAEVTAGSGYSFNSNGFSIGTSSEVNTNTNTYVGWQWRASNATAVSNTAGSVTSTVSANPTSGFSIVTFNAGAAGNKTVGHSLGVKPAMVIFKDRATTSSWLVWHQSLSSQTQSYLVLQTTAAVVNDSRIWANTAPTSTLLSFESNYTFNVNNNIVAYCFSEIAGYSAFGSYTGNGATDGVFVYLGFRPRWIMIKRTNATENWQMYDSSRNTSNVVGEYLLANTSGAGATITVLDMLSNGFKIRVDGTNPGVNASGSTYIYAAFAENPFKYSLAR